jgi:hypothetical protein
MKNNSKKWYRTDIGIVVLLVFFFPVGLYLMWRYTSWHKKVKWGITGFYGLLFVLTAIFSPSESYTNSVNKSQEKIPNGRVNQTVTTPAPTEAPKAVEKYKIEVTSQIVKKVSGKYRYFFDIRNKDVKNFEGDVSITLYNELQNSALGGDTFSTNKPIEPELGTSQYIDIYTGPTSVHGENGISKFKFVVKKNGQTVNEGEGQISTKYEDTDAYSF